MEPGRKPRRPFSQNEAQFILQIMASGTDNMTDKVFQHLRIIAPEEHQKLKEDRASYKEIHTLIEKVINENLSLATSLRGKVQHASSSDIQRLLNRTYTSGKIECMRHGLEVESFRMSIDRNQQGHYTVSTTRKGREFYPRRELTTLANIDSARMNQYRSIFFEALALLAQCAGIAVTIGDRALRGVQNLPSYMTKAIDEFVGLWNKATSNAHRAEAFLGFIQKAYLKDIFWSSVRLIFESMGWLDWVRLVVTLLATIVATFATEGLALIARIILALGSALTFFEKIVNLNKFAEIRMSLMQ